jgi:hypothetical protein
MAITLDNADGLPAVAVYIVSASPHNEVTTLTGATLTKCFVADEKPEHLIGDRRMIAIHLMKD